MAARPSGEMFRNPTSGGGLSLSGELRSMEAAGTTSLLALRDKRHPAASAAAIAAAAAAAEGYARDGATMGGGGGCTLPRSGSSLLGPAPPLSRCGSSGIGIADGGFPAISPSSSVLPTSSASLLQRSSHVDINMVPRPPPPSLVTPSPTPTINSRGSGGGGGGGLTTAVGAVRSPARAGLSPAAPSEVSLPSVLSSSSLPSVASFPAPPELRGVPPPLRLPPLAVALGTAASVAGTATVRKGTAEQSPQLDADGDTPMMVRTGSAPVRAAATALGDAGGFPRATSDVLPRGLPAFFLPAATATGAGASPAGSSWTPAPAAAMDAPRLPPLRPTQTVTSAVAAAAVDGGRPNVRPRWQPLPSPSAPDWMPRVSSRSVLPAAAPATGTSSGGSDGGNGSAPLSAASVGGHRHARGTAASGGTATLSPALSPMRLAPAPPALSPLRLVSSPPPPPPPADGPPLLPSVWMDVPPPPMRSLSAPAARAADAAAARAATGASTGVSAQPLQQPLPPFPGAYRSHEVAATLASLRHAPVGPTPEHGQDSIDRRGRMVPNVSMDEEEEEVVPPKGAYGDRRGGGGWSDRQVEGALSSPEPVWPLCAGRIAGVADSRRTQSYQMPPQPCGAAMDVSPAMAKYAFRGGPGSGDGGDGGYGGGRPRGESERRSPRPPSTAAAAVATATTGCDGRSGGGGGGGGGGVVDGASVHDEGVPCAYDGCGFRTTRNGQMTRHVKRVHLKLRPYACNYCETPFASRSDRNRHIKLRHSVAIAGEAEEG
ncbi:hypothetical protein MMPV_005274 [Pyropia vietnamensis]